MDEGGARRIPPDATAGLLVHVVQNESEIFSVV